MLFQLLTKQCKTYSILLVDIQRQACLLFLPKLKIDKNPVRWQIIQKCCFHEGYGSNFQHRDKTCNFCENDHTKRVLYLDLKSNFFESKRMRSSKFCHQF